MKSKKMLIFVGSRAPTDGLAQLFARPSTGKWIRKIGSRIVTCGDNVSTDMQYAI